MEPRTQDVVTDSAPAPAADLTQDFRAHYRSLVRLAGPAPAPRPAPLDPVVDPRHGVAGRRADGLAIHMLATGRADGLEAPGGSHVTAQIDGADLLLTAGAYRLRAVLVGPARKNLPSCLGPHC